MTCSRYCACVRILLPFIVALVFCWHTACIIEFTTPKVFVRRLDGRTKSEVSRCPA